MWVIDWMGQEYKRKKLKRVMRESVWFGQMG